MKKFLIFTLVSLIVNTNIIYAQCTTKDTEYFKSIEDKYQITYDFDKETKTYTLNLSYGDISSFSYVILGDNIDDINSTVTKFKIIITNVTPGEYIIHIAGATESCNDIVKTEEITIPKYNEYAFDPACEGIEEFVLCSPTYDKELDYNTFISRVNSYKKSKANNDNKKDNIEEKPTITEWLKNNSQYIIYGVIGIIGLIIIIIIVKVIYNRERKRRRLE